MPELPDSKKVMFDVLRKVRGDGELSQLGDGALKILADALVGMVLVELNDKEDCEAVR